METRGTVRTARNKLYESADRAGRHHILLIYRTRFVWTSVASFICVVWTKCKPQSNHPVPSSYKNSLLQVYAADE